MADENKEMKKEDFYKYLADLENLSKTQLIMVKSVIEGMLKEPYDTVFPYTYILPKNNNDNIPNCCKNCPNFKVGAVCHCTLPYLEQFRDPLPQQYTSPLPGRVITTDGTGIYTEPNTVITSNGPGTYYNSLKNKKRR